MSVNGGSEGERMSSTPAVESAGKLGSISTSLWAYIASAVSKIAAARSRELRLCETLSLGDKRMLAIIECDHQRFLIAATPQSISLLQSLSPIQSEESPQKCMQ